MERWTGRVAVVTGTSSGIGEAIARDLVNHGLKVVGIARRVERVEATALELKNAPGKLYPLKADITKEEDITKIFNWTKENLGGVDILINNAGKFQLVHQADVSTENLRQLYDLNVLGLSICTRDALKSMRERDVDDGYIIHINSVAGQQIMGAANFSLYSSTKHAVRILTEGLRKELSEGKSKIRVTSISPGVVDTEMFWTSGCEQFGKPLDDYPKLKAQDISNSVLYVLSNPAHVQVHELTIRPVGEM